MEERSREEEGGMEFVHGRGSSKEGGERKRKCRREESLIKER